MKMTKKCVAARRRYRANKRKKGGGVRPYGNTERTARGTERMKRADAVTKKWKALQIKKGRPWKWGMGTPKR